MAKDGKPAEFNKENVPYQPKHFLPVSIKGLNDGDYAMIYGYPGGTNRYETSFGIKLKVDIDNPALVNLRDARLKAMMAEMVKDPQIKLQLASSYAGIANYWKFFDGETKQLIKHNVVALKKNRRLILQRGQREKVNTITCSRTSKALMTPGAHMPRPRLPERRHPWFSAYCFCFIT